MRRSVHGAFVNRWGVGRGLVWVLGLICAAAMVFGSAGTAYAKVGNALPNLGLESYNDYQGYQFESGAYYLLNNDGRGVTKSTGENWNIHWTGNPEKGTLELKDAQIQGSFFVPGGTDIKVFGNCIITTDAQAIQQQTDGDLTVDLAPGSKLTLDCTTQGACLLSGLNPGNGGNVSIVGSGALVYGARQYNGSLAVNEGVLHIGGSVTVNDLDDAKPNELNAQSILIDGNARVEMLGGIASSEGDITIVDNAVVDVKGDQLAVVKPSVNLKVLGAAKLTVANTGSGDSNQAIACDYGSLVVEGALTASAAPTGDATITVDNEATVTGTLNISGGCYGLMSNGSDFVLRVENGGKVSVSNARQDGIYLWVGKEVIVDGGYIEVSGCKNSMQLPDTAKLTVKNGSTLDFDAIHYGISGLGERAFSLSDSTVRAVAGNEFSWYDPSISYSTDANLKVGESADSAKAVDLDKMDFQAKYVEIVPSADHTWASEWTINDTHHWHVCTNSHCALDPTTGIAQMGGYAEHSGGTATCTTKAACAACGKEYGAVNASNHFNLVKTDARPASHLSSGNIAYWRCEGCNKYFSDEAGTKEIALKDTIIPRLSGHVADGTGWHSDASNHWKTCICGAKLCKAAHDFAWVIDKYPTATEVGSKHEECEACGYARTAVDIPVPSFSDVVPGSWYAESVAFVAGRGLMLGYGNSGLFGVGCALTRGELATILWRHAVDPSEGFESSAAVNKTGMADVSDGQFYTEAANWAVENGVINGYVMPDGSRAFGPNDPVTLEQIVAVIGNLTADKDEVADVDPSVLDRYTDKAGISAWAVKSVAWATKVGLVNGGMVADGTRAIRAAESVARERAAGVLYNAFSIGLME